VPEVERTDPEGIDYGWVMQVTFVASIFLGVPVVVALSIPVTLESWADRASFAVTVGAVVWFSVATVTYLYARQNN